MRRVIKKGLAAALLLACCAANGQADDRERAPRNAAPSTKMDRSPPASEAPSRETIKPRREQSPSPDSQGAGKSINEQVAPIDDGQPIFTPHKAKK